MSYEQEPPESITKGMFCLNERRFGAWVLEQDQGGEKGYQGPVPSDSGLSPGESDYRATLKKWLPGTILERPVPAVRKEGMSAAP